VLDDGQRCRAIIAHFHVLHFRSCDQTSARCARAARVHDIRDAVGMVTAAAARLRFGCGIKKSAHFGFKRRLMEE
jgi:hypothetical protein